MTLWPRYLLRLVAPAIPAPSSFDATDLVWQLGLDQIQSHTGVILRKHRARVASAGTSTFYFPGGTHVLVRRLSEKPRGEKLHNRYILTDLGGVSFGIGLDDGDEGATDDVTLLDRDPYVVRWSQYGGIPPAGFEQGERPVEIVGTRRVGQGGHRGEQQT